MVKRSLATKMPLIPGCRQKVLHSADCPQRIIRQYIWYMSCKWWAYPYRTWCFSLMIVYRFVSDKFKNYLSGKGAELAGGCWNSKTVQVVYTSETRVLCVAEVVVHTPLGYYSERLLSSYNRCSWHHRDKGNQGDCPAIRLEKYSLWISTQQVGNKSILTNKYAVLKVPSAVVAGDYNYCSILDILIFN